MFRVMPVPENTLTHRVMILGASYRVKLEITGNIFVQNGYYKSACPMFTFLCTLGRQSMEPQISTTSSLGICLFPHLHGYKITSISWYQLLQFTISYYTLKFWIYWIGRKCISEIEWFLSFDHIV